MVSSTRILSHLVPTQMLFQSVLSAAALLFVGVAAQHPPVFTATRVFNTLTDVAPFIVKGTTTVTWTQSPSTVLVQPTGPGV
ncbi:hypothetical protein B0H17DRAFT_1336616 [Mycena rosella]|uniref:Uncharacterized protein n=1 Tax=Mycena rosella TaxID=1033263 RepID=A0AAD7CUR2_MYCRO|nr:hypothetical protein B0H17DRAFT_1336616 [Mycena rosella]